MKNVKKVLTLALVGIFSAGAVLSVKAAPFDASWYAAQNPDVVAVYGNTPEALRAHYERHGRNEYRMSSDSDVEAQLHKLFDLEEYKTLYPDVVQVLGNNPNAIFQHYLTYGLLEGRRPSEEVSQEAALELRKVVTQALADAGLNAKPGSADLVKVLKGEITAKSGAVQAAMTQVQAVVKDAVNTTIVADAANPASNDDSDSSDNSSSSSSDNSGNQGGTSGDQNQGGSTGSDTSGNQGGGEGADTSGNQGGGTGSDTSGNQGGSEGSGTGGDQNQGGGEGADTSGNQGGGDSADTTADQANS